MWLDMDEAAVYLKVSRRTLQRQVSDNSIKSKKEGRRRLVWAEENISANSPPTEPGVGQTVGQDSELKKQILDLEREMRHLSDNLAQMSDKADQEQKQLEVKDQQIEKLQKALDQEQQLNAISQRNVENLSNQIESQRLQLEESQRPKPLIARLKAVFVTD
jgi:excisionase family DNA binding protein